MTEKVLSDLNKRGRDSKKFVFAMAALLANVFIIGVALLVLTQIYGSKPEALDWFGFGGFLAMALAALNALPLGYVGGTTWQEKAVRVAAIGRGLKEEKDGPAE